MPLRMLEFTQTKVAIGLLLVVGGACKSSKSPTPNPSVAATIDAAPLPSSVASPAGLVYAQVSKTNAAVPQRYTAPLPSTVEEFKRFQAGDIRFPPATYAQDAICLGDTAVLGSVMTAVKRARQQAAALTSAYATLIEYCTPSKAYCEQALRWISDESPVRNLGYHFLVQCQDPGAAAAFAAVPAPAEAVVVWHTKSYSDTPICTQRFADALVSVAAQNLDVQRNGWQVDLRLATNQLAGCSAPWATAALVAAHKSARGTNKLVIGLALGRASAPELKAIYAAACKTQPESADCGRGGIESRNALVDPPAPSFDALEAVIVDKAKRDYVRATALYDLAARDRKRALDVLQKVRRNEGALPAELRIAANTITAFRDAQAMLEDLQQLGMAGALAAGDMRRGVKGLLIEAGRVHHFDPETGMWPNHHDSLLRALAAMDSDGMNGIIFDEIAPPVDSEDPYQLVAYVNGHRYTTQAQNFGDWYDVNAAVGLLNALAKERNIATRYASLSQSSGNDAYVISGPEPALQALFQRGLLQPSDAAQDVQDAKAFERSVLDKMAAPAARP